MLLDDIVQRRPNIVGIDHTIKRGWAYKWILGSAFIGSVWEFLVFFVISIAWFLLFDFAIEPAFPTLFPVSHTYQLVLFFIVTFAGISYTLVERKLYARMIRSLVIIFGNTKTLASELTSFTSNDNVSVRDYFSFDNNGDVKYTNSSLAGVMEDLNHITRSIPFAQRHEHRTFMSRSKHKYQTVDESDIGSNLEIANLPMAMHLKNELKLYSIDTSGRGLADQMYDMISIRLGILYNQQLLEAPLFQSTDRQTSLITTHTADLESNKMIGATPIVIGFLKTSLWLWCFTIPWVLWGEYRWWSVLVMFVVVWPALALFEAGRRLSNPFASYSTSPFVWNDLDLVAQSSSENIDRIFDQKFRLMTGRNKTTVF